MRREGPPTSSGGKNRGGVILSISRDQILLIVTNHPGITIPEIMVIIEVDRGDTIHYNREYATIKAKMLSMVKWGDLVSVPSPIAKRCNRWFIPGAIA